MYTELSSRSNLFFFKKKSVSEINNTLVNDFKLYFSHEIFLSTYKQNELNCPKFHFSILLHPTVDKHQNAEKHREEIQDQINLPYIKIKQVNFHF